MTINVTLVSPEGVYVSSDFRLSYLRGSRPYTDHEAQKVVLCSTPAWNALVQFTGVGKAGRSFDTSTWLARVARETRPSDQLDDLLERLKSIERFIGRGRLTFTVCGFAGWRPFLYLVSNFQHIDPSQDATVDRMTVSTLRVTQPVSIVTGLREFVAPSDIREMRHVLSRHPPARRVHSLLDRVNVRAFRRAGEEGGISESSCTAHLLPDGTGEITPHRVNEGGEYLPAFATGMLAATGIELKAKLGGDGRDLPRRWVGMTIKNSGEGTSYVATVFRNVQDLPGGELRHGKPNPFALTIPNAKDAIAVRTGPFEQGGWREYLGPK